MNNTTVPLKLQDFRNFLFLSWAHLGLPEPTPVQYDIASYLQHGPKRLLIEAFRGVGKSWITSAFVCWLLLMDNQKEILIISASKTRSDEFSTFTLRMMMEFPPLAHLAPTSDTQRVSRVAFDVAPHDASHSPSVKSVGITGQIAGSRADVVVLDDVEVPNNSSTQMMRDKLSESIKEADAVVKPGTGRIIYLGTPQNVESIYNKLEERGYEMRIWPAHVPDDKMLKQYGHRLAPSISAMVGVKTVGTSTDPKRFNDEDLAERRLSYGMAGFALQFLLDTTLSDANRYPLKQSDLVVMNLDVDQGPMRVVWGAARENQVRDLPNLGFSGDKLYNPISFGSEDMKFSPYTGSTMFVDPSGRGKDETAYAVVKELHGQLFATACSGFAGGYADETLEKIAHMAIKHNVNTLLIESNFGDGMFTQLLRPVMLRCGWKGLIEEVHSSGQKEARILDVLEPLMNRHKLIVDHKVIEDDYNSVRAAEATRGERAPQYSLIYQMTHLTRDRGSLRQDDRVEALAGACQHYVSRVNRDQDQAIDQHRDAAFTKDIEEFITRTKHWKPTKGPVRPNTLGLRARKRR